MVKIVLVVLAAPPSTPCHPGCEAMLVPTADITAAFTALLRELVADAPSRGANLDAGLKQLASMFGGGGMPSMGGPGGMPGLGGPGGAGGGMPPGLGGPKKK